MHVHPAQSTAVELGLLHEQKRLVVLRDDSLGQPRQQSQDLFPVAQPSAGKFPDYEWVRDDEVISKNLAQPFTAAPQVVDPNR